MNNNQPSREKLNRLYPDRNHRDVSNLMPYVNKKFYQYHPQQRNMYRTVFFRRNAFTNKIHVYYDNFVVGVPPSGMDEVNPRLIQAINRTNHLSDSPF
mgnify:CR=1 FL=1